MSRWYTDDCATRREGKFVPYVGPAILSHLVFLACAGLAHAASPASDMSSGRRCVEVGWHDGFQADEGWLPEPWQVGSPDEKAATSIGPDGCTFTVESPNRGMAWTRTVNPIWVQQFPFLEVDYRIGEGTVASGFPKILLFDDITGPVTPNALNPQNPLAGEHQALVGPLSAGQTRAVFDLTEVFPTDRVARITLLLTAGDGPSSIALRSLAFWATDPRSASPEAPPASAALLPEGGTISTSAAGSWHPVELPQSATVSAFWLAKVLKASAAWKPGQEFEQEGVRFRLAGADRAALASGIMEMGNLEIRGNWKGCELGLLLAGRVVGNAGLGYGRGSDRPRTSITSPHQLAIQLDYDDGSTSMHFPWSVVQKKWVVEGKPQVYIVPMDPAKRLRRIAVLDQMNYGQVFLLAASVNSASTPSFLSAHPQPQPPDRRNVAPPVPGPTRWHREGDRLVVENAWFRLAADMKAGLRLESFKLVPFDREILPGGSSVPLIEAVGEDGQGLPMHLESFDAETATGGTDFDWRWKLGASPRSLSIQMRVQDIGLIRLGVTLNNAGNEAWKPTVRYPQIKGCRVASAADDCWYLVGTRNALLNHEPVSVEKPYSTYWPLPLIDLFADRAGGGLGLFFTDTNQQYKTLEFRQGEGGTDLSVAFPILTVPAGGSLALSPMVLMAHTGDWREPLGRYREWARSTFPQSDRPKGSFYCRRDYPVGGTGYLFDPVATRYTSSRLIEESNAAFGRIDMIDISGWAFHYATGRVGDYLTNDLGGLTELRRMVQSSHEMGYRVGLYFEGYLIDRRSELAKRALPDWQLILKDGTPRWWSGEMEFFACPAVADWQQALAEMIAEVADKTGADAVYADELGLLGLDRACWSADHGHEVPSNPVQSERTMLRTIRQALDRKTPHVALYIEYTPPDGLMDLVDAAFDYSMADRHAGQHPTKLPLYRYVFPELVSFEMLSEGIRPGPTEVDNLHRCVFHGLGIWLKGRAGSWYTPQFRELCRRAHPVFEDHADVLHSSQCEPLIPTLRDGLYANRFTGPDRSILTLYNAGYSSLSGDLVRTPLPSDWAVTDLLAQEPVDCSRQGDQATIRGSVSPHSVAVFLLSPQGTREKLEP